MVVLDASIIISALKNQKKAIEAIEKYKNKEQAAITILNKYELLRGVERFDKDLKEFVNSLKIYDLGEKEINLTLEVYENLKKKGGMINEFDILIAGIVMANNETLLTEDNHFKKIPNLNVIII